MNRLLLPVLLVLLAAAGCVTYRSALAAGPGAYPRTTAVVLSAVRLRSTVQALTHQTVTLLFLPVSPLPGGLPVEDQTMRLESDQSLGDFLLGAPRVYDLNWSGTVVFPNSRHRLAVVGRVQIRKLGDAASAPTETRVLSLEVQDGGTPLFRLDPAAVLGPPYTFWTNPLSGDELQFLAASGGRSTTAQLFQLYPQGFVKARAGAPRGLVENNRLSGASDPEEDLDLLAAYLAWRAVAMAG